MSNPFNLFEKYLQIELQRFFRTRVNAEVHVGQDDTITVLPRLVINVTSGTEGVFQSGVYQVTVEFIAKTNMDGETGDDEPDANRILFGQVLDGLQRDDLREQLMSGGTLFLCVPTGTVLGSVKPLEAGDRMWIRAVECDFIGFSNAAS